MAMASPPWRALSAILALLALAPLQAEVLRYTESTNSDTEIALGYPVPIPVDSQLPVNGFRRYQSLFERHQDLAFSSADVASVIVGTTLAGRDIHAYIIGDADDRMAWSGLTEPAVLINGAIHAREWASPEVVTDLFETLVDGRGDVALSDYLLDNVNLVLVPVLNVDGFLQTQRFADQVTPTPDDVRTTTEPPQFEQPRDGRMRRKNMRGVDETLATDADRLLGIDLNRNNARFFDAPGGGNSPDPQSLIYRGEFPASEPEIQALLAAAALAPTDRLRLYIDAHSFSRVYFVPSTSNSRRNGITNTLAARMAATTTQFGQPAYLPVIEVPGESISTTATFFAYEHQIPAWTLEIEPPCGFQGLPCGAANYAGAFGVSSDGFILPASEIARSREENTAAHLLGLYHQAGPPSVRRIVIIDDLASETVLDAQWNPTGDGRRQYSGTPDDLTLSEDTRYTLWIGFDKPMRYRDDSDRVTDYPGQAVVGRRPIATLRGTDVDGGAFAFALPFSTDAWRGEPGDAPTGYTRYRDDAIVTAFTLPASLGIGPTPGDATLEFDVRDFAGMALDADPATVVDYANGAWVGYESTGGTGGDSGGIDRTVSLKVQGTATPTPAATGGGGAIDIPTLLWLLLAGVLMRRRSLSPSDD